MVHYSNLSWSFPTHVVYCGIFVCIAGFCWGQAFPVTATPTTLQVVSMLGLAISLKLFQDEVAFVWMTRKFPPGEAGWPIVGHLLDFIRDPVDQIYVRFSEKYGPIFTYRLFSEPVAVGFDTKFADWIVSMERKGVTGPVTLPILIKVLGTSSLTIQSGKAHKRIRRLMDPSFTPGSLKEYTELMDVTIRKELLKWSENKEFLTSSHFSNLTMRVFFVCAVGLCDEALFEELSPLFEAWFGGLFSLSTTEIPGLAMSKSMNARRRLVEIFDTLIQECQNKIDESDDGDNGRKNLLKRFCDATDGDDSDSLTLVQLIENIMFLVFAGHDTTKGTLSTMLALLEQNPSVLAALESELEHLTEPLDYDELKTAPVLNAVMAETWRLHPPVPHHLTRAYSALDYNGYHFPKGTMFALPLFNAPSTDVFRLPKEFRIERWLTKDHPLFDPVWSLDEPMDYTKASLKYRTFNLGPHACLGAHFARLETRVAVARIVRNYHFETRNTKLIAFPLRRLDCEFRLSPKTT